MLAELVVNPMSRRGARFGESVREALTRLGVELVAEGAPSRPIDAIVVAGGDGTLASQIPRALELDVPLGIVPLGTFNDLARALTIPPDIEAACDVIASGRELRIDTARVNGVYYATEASIGLSSRLARRQRPEDKQRYGILAIAASLVQALRYARPFHVDVTWDGHHKRFKTVQLTVANSARFGGFVSVRDAAIDDGRLDLYAVQIESLAQFVSVAGAIVGGRRRPAPGLRTYSAKAFEIFTRRPHHISADGEPAGTTPARFEILPKSLSVFVP